MSQEELKFSNTIVASGHDLLLIGGTSGRQKRERKVPSRYQDTGNYISDFVFRGFFVMKTCDEQLNYPKYFSMIILKLCLKFLLAFKIQVSIEQEQGDNEQKNQDISKHR